MPDLQPDNPRVLDVLDVLDGIGWPRKLKYDAYTESLYLFHFGWHTAPDEIHIPIIEKCLREWLEKHGWSVDARFDHGKLCGYDIRDNLRHFRGADGDYLTAQITAAEALLKEMT